VRVYKRWLCNFHTWGYVDSGAFPNLICVCVSQTQILWFMICDGQIWDAFFWRTETQKNVFLIFGAPVKKVLYSHTSYASSPLNDALLMDVEVASLQDDCDWWFEWGEEALEIQEEVPEESLGGGASSLLKEDPPCFHAVVGSVSMAYSAWFQRRPVSHHHDWIRWRLFCFSFAEVRSAFWWIYPLHLESHPLEAGSFERRTPKEGSSGGLSWSCACLDAHERFPNGVAVGFWNDIGGRMVTTWRRCLFFAWTGPFPSLFLTFPDPCMTAKLHIGGGSTISLKPCTTRPAGSARLILRLERSSSAQK